MLDWINQFINLSGFSGGASVGNSIDLLLNSGTADLRDPSFKSDYAVMFGLALIISAVLGVFSALLLLGSKHNQIGSSVHLMDRTLFFARTYAVALLIPVVYGVSIYVSSYFTTNVLMELPWAQNRVSWFDKLTSFVSQIGDPINASIVTGLNTLFTTIIEFEATAIRYLPPAIALMMPVAFSLTIGGKAGVGLWRWLFGVAVVTVVARPAMMTVLIMGNWTVSKIEAGKAASIVGTIVLLCAALVPFIIYDVFRKYGADRIPAVYVTNTQNQDNSRSSLLVGTAVVAAGITARSIQSQQRGSSGNSASATMAQTAMTMAASKVATSTPQTAAVVLGSQAISKMTSKKPSP